MASVRPVLGQAHTHTAWYAGAVVGNTVSNRSCHLGRWFCEALLTRKAEAQLGGFHGHPSRQRPQGSNSRWKEPKGGSHAIDWRGLKNIHLGISCVSYSPTTDTSFVSVALPPSSLRHSKEVSCQLSTCNFDEMLKMCHFGLPPLSPTFCAPPSPSTFSRHACLCMLVCMAHAYGHKDRRGSWGSPSWTWTCSLLAACTWVPLGRGRGLLGLFLPSDSHWSTLPDPPTPKPP